MEWVIDPCPLEVDLCLLGEFGKGLLGERWTYNREEDVTWREGAAGRSASRAKAQRGRDGGGALWRACGGGLVLSSEAGELDSTLA